MLYNGKEVLVSIFYEKEVEIYKVFYTKSGRDEDGIYGSYNEVEEFNSREEAEKFRANLEDSNNFWNNYSYSDISVDGPYKKTKKVYLNVEDMNQYMIQYLTKLGYIISKEKK